jgi:hypothetical protein
MTDMKQAPVGIVLTLADNKVGASPSTATLNWKEGPDSVVWDVSQMAVKAAFVAIEFKKDSPFKAMGEKLSGGILGTENTKIGGDYDYTIIAYDSNGKEIARLDPRIVNQPR